MRKVLGILFVTLTLTSGAWAQTKKRITVMDFEFGAVQASANQIFGGNAQDVGKGIADMLVTKLVKDGTYSVIERQALAKIIGEQNFSNSDRANPDTAAKIGRILGVDAMVIGSITQFGREDQNRNIGGGGGGWVGGKFGHGIGGVGTSKSKAYVAIDARLVDTNTGEILAAAQGKGESQRSGTSLLGGGGNGSGGGGGSYSMGSSNFDTTILGEATNAAIADAAKQLEDAAGKLPTVVVTVSGLVADVEGNTLIMNVGTKAGVKVGDHLGVFHKGKEIRDPATGKVLKVMETKLGDVTITQADETSATGTYSGSTAPVVGDAVHSE
jgi:curli biogenesis system outer membrane secretion channel CsgG